MMILNYKPPKKIIRKYTDYWTNKDEIEFILYDLPVECTIRGFDLEKSLEGMYYGLLKRKIPENWNKQELIGITNFALNNQPEVWNLGLKQKNKADNKWCIKYPSREIVIYTSY